jgi:hypothetical protein
MLYKPMCKQDNKEAYLIPMFDDVPVLSSLTQIFVPATSSQQTRRESI